MKRFENQFLRTSSLFKNNETLRNLFSQEFTPEKSKK